MILESLPDPDREIDAREADGITVRWYLRPDSTHYVTAEDVRLGTFDLIEAPEGKGAEVFMHPYSYAAAVALSGVCPDCLPEAEAA